MKTQILIITSALFLITSCGDNVPTVNSADNIENIVIANPYDLVLNNGEKWKVNAEMMVHVKSMEADIESYASKNTATYAELGEKLNTHIRALTSSCTMKGKSHDELHKWLLPFINLKKDFIKSTTEKEYEKNYQKIVESMQVFNNYFS